MPSAGCLQLKSRKSTNYCPVTGNLLPRTPAEPPFLFTGTIETKRSVTTLPCDTHECRRTIVFVATSLRHPACIWFNAYLYSPLVRNLPPFTTISMTFLSQRLAPDIRFPICNDNRRSQPSGSSARRGALGGPR